MDTADTHDGQEKLGSSSYYPKRLLRLTLIAARGTERLNLSNTYDGSFFCRHEEALLDASKKDRWFEPLQALEIVGSQRSMSSGGAAASLKHSWRLQQGEGIVGVEVFKLEQALAAENIRCRSHELSDEGARAIVRGVHLRT